MQRDCISKKIHKLLYDVKDAWDYLYGLTGGEDSLLNFLRIRQKKGLLELKFFYVSFLKDLKTPIEEFPDPREVCFLEFYFDCLRARINKRERELLDFAIENNLSYLEKLLSTKSKTSQLPLFFKKEKNKVFVSREFMQWAELTKSYIISYSKERNMTFEEALKEFYLTEIVEEIEALERK